MPSENLPNKRDVMLALLAEASVFIHLDPRGAAVRVPPWFKNQAQLVLQVGFNMAVPIPDLDVGEEAITCTLSFSRRPFYCSIPWKSVFGLVGEGGPGLVWPDDVPLEVAAQAQKQAGQKPTAKKAEGRARLHAVATEASEAESSEAGPGEKTAAVVEAAAPVAPAVRPSPVAVPSPALASTAEDAVEAGSESESPETAKPQRSPSSSKGTGKRELPSYLRVVK
jgi:stringent starvation protein B